MSTKTYMIALLSASAMLATACSQDGNANATDAQSVIQKTAQAPAYLSHVTKAGAAIGLSHDYDGHTKVGETETIRVTLSDRYESGVLTVSANGSNGLSVSPENSGKSFRMDGTENHTLDVLARADAEGIYSLNIQMEANAGPGQVARSTATIALYVGESVQFEKNSAGKNQPQKSQAAPKLSIMDAEETIITE